MTKASAYLHWSVDVKFVFDSARLECLPSSCLLAILAMFYLLFCLVLTLEMSEMSVICFYNQNNSTSSPGLLG